MSAANKIYDDIPEIYGLTKEQIIAMRQAFHNAPDDPIEPLSGAEIKELTADENDLDEKKAKQREYQRKWREANQREYLREWRRIRNDPKLWAERCKAKGQARLETYFERLKADPERYAAHLRKNSERKKTPQAKARVRELYQKLKADPERYAAYMEKKKLNAQKWWAALSDEKKKAYGKSRAARLKERKAQDSSIADRYREPQRRAAAKYYAKRKNDPEFLAKQRAAKRERRAKAKAAATPQTGVKNDD